jgi:hypothetical protein
MEANEADLPDTGSHARGHRDLGRHDFRVGDVALHLQHYHDGLDSYSHRVSTARLSHRVFLILCLQLRSLFRG